jgi:hypothetical protein
LDFLQKESTLYLDIVCLNPHHLNADFMFKKLLAFLLKSRTSGLTPSEEQATPPFQEECKLSILWIIKIQLKNPSRGTLALVRLFVIIISILLLLFILRLNHIELKVTPAEKKAISQIVHTIAHISATSSPTVIPGKKKSGEWGPGSNKRIPFLATHYVHRQ